MSSCRSVDSLIHLHREGELTREERALVVEHLKSCAACASMHRELLAIDEALQPMRAGAEVYEADQRLLAETMRRLSGTETDARPAPLRRPVADLIAGWLRPALSFALVAASVLFIVQQSRDTRKLLELERRMVTLGSAGRSGNLLGESDRIPFANLSTARAGNVTPYSSLLNRSAIGGDVLTLLGSGLNDMFRQRSGLFHDLSRHYPNLSTINLEDGIDEHEQSILATEGKALLKELEQMIQKGESKP